MNTHITYTYDASGNKLRTTVGRQMTIGPIHSHSMGETADPQGGGIGGGIVNPIPSSSVITTDYCGNAVYLNDTLSMLLTEEGYITFDERGEPKYHYYLRDHLGSIRVVFDQRGTVEQLNQYYPDGTLFGKQSKNGTVQPYKFGGKELQRDAGLDEYDFGARWMDPVIGGRFTTMDPMCEKYYGVSPYIYCHGDPVNAVDPDGRDEYLLSDYGYILWGASNNMPYHTIYAMNGSSINVNKSFIDNCYQGFAFGRSSEGRGGKISTYNITIYTAERGEGKGIFEFLSNNSKVEWSFVTLSSPDGSQDLIGTSNSDGDDLSMTYIIDMASSNQSVSQATHSHGFDNSLPSQGDINVARNVNSKYPNASLYIYDRLGYNQYDEFSSTELNIVVTPDKVLYEDDNMKK